MSKMCSSQKSGSQISIEQKPAWFLVRPWFLVGITILLSGCSIEKKAALNSLSPASTPIPPAKLEKSNTGWQPSFSGLGEENLKGTTQITQSTLYAAAPMTGLADPWSAQKMVTVDLGYHHAPTDFGPGGSISLTADVLGYPYSGGAFPILASFYIMNETNQVIAEYVNLTSSCSTQGMYTCSNGWCNANSNCAPIAAQSGFADRGDWEQHQIPGYGYTSSNLFPRCDRDVNGWTTCPANLSQLKTGRYFAKYILLSDAGQTSNLPNVALRVKVVQKKDTFTRNSAEQNLATSNGGIKLNVILVGDKTISDSHRTKGAQNLNLLYQEVNRILKNAIHVGIREIKVYEWNNANGGARFAAADYEDMGLMFSSGSQGVDSADDGNYINIFMVSDIAYSGSSFTILGLAGGVFGPPVNGTETSGLAFSTFDELLHFNSDCASASANQACARDFLENDFLEMAATIAHELGHYLGLNHPTEQASNGGTQIHDGLTDTPRCASRSFFGFSMLDQRACYQDATNTAQPPSQTTCKAACDAAILAATGSDIRYFAANNNGFRPNEFCPGVNECQFNHLMWYTTKNRSQTSGTWKEDGNLISLQSSALVQWDPFVR